MTIFIGKKKVTEKVATRFISELDGFVEKIVGAWRDSNIAHHFEDEKSFKKGVCKNLTTLSSPETIRTLFRPRNYLFSTQKEEEDRRETLYFKNCAMKKTGRLRQQHPKGPLAKIDKKAKTHVFLSKRRFEDLKKWHKKHKRCLPDFKPAEERRKIDKHHIEFAYDGKEVSGWHESGGTVKILKQPRDRHIRSALKEILGRPRF
jgi:hypothetical protein